VAGIVKRIGRDRLRLRLGAEEIALLRSLPEQLRSVLAATDAAAEEPTDLLGPGQGSTPADAWGTPGGADSGDTPGGPEGEPAGRRGRQADPVLGRLFPRAYLEADDAERDAEYQRLVRDDLLEAKLANLDVVTSTLDRGTVSLRRWTVELTEDEAGSWLGALNDLRLALGVRLGITEDFDGDIDPSDPRAPALHVLSYLGWLEENLVDALSSG
jgi:Domain of unknown function (DUF2017)